VKVWIVSSELTFVPQNYYEVLEPLVDLPEVKGLIILRNRSPLLFLKGLYLWLRGLAPGIGSLLMRNYLASFFDQRARLFKSRSKELRYFASINSPDCLDFIRSEGIDLLINARTRDIYKEEVLALPRFGCLNIHHGLLPHQRGVLCDLWALTRGDEAGFSIHRMSKKLDDGEILCVRTVPVNKELRSFADYLKLGARMEGEELRRILVEFRETKRFNTLQNERSSTTRYFKNPKAQDLRDFKKQGFRV
jgi:methionyl-tRNA formyltransferase